MSLKATGTSAKILAHAKGSPTCFQDNHTVANQHTQTHLERERKLARELFEAYLQSSQFEKDVYELESTLTIKIERRVDTSIY